MKEIWKRFEAEFSKIDTLAELNSGASKADVEALEKKLGVSLPKDFRDSYLTHNGQNGISFLFGWRLWPLEEIIESDLEKRKAKKEHMKVFDSSGVLKDCVTNHLWIGFADNGGSGILAIDLDPGDAGTLGQVIALYEDGTELEANSFKEFMETTISDIESGKMKWDEEAGEFYYE